MKKVFKFSLIALMAMFAFNACNTEKGPAVTDLEVSIAMPEGFNSAFDGDIIITSEELGKSYQGKVEAGKAVFSGIYVGVYDLSATGKMTKKAAEAAAPSIKFQGDIILNATQKALVVDVTAENKTELTASWSLESKLVISKIFCNGTRFNAGKSDNGPAKYYEIFNNSDEVQYLDGLCLASAHGLGTGKNDCALYLAHKDEATYASRIVKLPGTHGTDKKIALEPGKSFVIAWNAQNYIKTEDSSADAKDKMTMTFDLTGADYEIDGTGRTRPPFVDNANVPNMPYLHDCFPAGAGLFDLSQSMFIFFATEAEVESWETGVDDKSYMGMAAKWPGKRVANEIIIDGVETFKTGAGQHKRIADIVDAAGVESKVWEGEIFIRKIQGFVDGRMILMDTNNSANDFAAVGSKDRENFDGSHLVIRDYSAEEIQPGR